MKFWELDKLFLFFIFVIPGFISLKVYELIFPTEKKDSSQQLVDAIAYSCINYALLSWLIYIVEKANLYSLAPKAYFVFYLFVIFFAPIIWVFIWKWIRNLEILQKNIPHPTLKPWDYVFSQRKHSWVIVTLNNGDKETGVGNGGRILSFVTLRKRVFLLCRAHPL